MPYDDALAGRIEELLLGEPGLTQKKMFGGLGFMLHGNMAAAASSQGGLMLRCDPARTAEYLAQDGVARFSMKGREMDGWLLIDVETVSTDDALARWVEVGADYARSLPPK